MRFPRVFVAVVRFAVNSVALPNLARTGARLILRHFRHRVTRRSVHPFRSNRTCAPDESAMAKRQSCGKRVLLVFRQLSDIFYSTVEHRVPSFPVYMCISVFFRRSGRPIPVPSTGLAFETP